MPTIQISAGDKLPHVFNVIIEIPAEGGSIKYEVDKDSGLLMVDRFMPVAMHSNLVSGLKWKVGRIKMPPWQCLKKVLKIINLSSIRGVPE